MADTCAPSTNPALAVTVGRLAVAGAWTADVPEAARRRRLLTPGSLGIQGSLLTTHDTLRLVNSEVVNLCPNPLPPSRRRDGVTNTRSRHEPCSSTYTPAVTFSSVASLTDGVAAPTTDSEPSGRPVAEARSR